MGFWFRFEGTSGFPAPWQFLPTPRFQEPDRNPSAWVPWDFRFPGTLFWNSGFQEPGRNAPESSGFGENFGFPATFRLLQIPGFQEPARKPSAWAPWNLGVPGTPCRDSGFLEKGLQEFLAGPPESSGLRRRPGFPVSRNLPGIPWARRYLGTWAFGQVHVKGAPGSIQAVNQKKPGKIHLKRGPGPVWFYSSCQPEKTRQNTFKKGAWSCLGFRACTYKEKKKDWCFSFTGFHPEREGRHFVSNPKP